LPHAGSLHCTVRSLSEALAASYPDGVDVSTPTSPPDLVVRLSRTVARRPHVVAVEADDGVLTYEALDRLSSRLAQRLRALLLPTGSETPRVGVSLPRGATELVALLAVLGAGAAYVPLDPSHPIDRLRLVLEDAAPDVLIVHPASPLAQLAAARHVVWLDGLSALEAAAPAPARPVVPRPDATAYVMFTSGSTGRPKGVEITRGALASFLSAMAHTPGLAQHDRLLAVTTTAFDIAALDLFLPLWVGATVIIADRETAQDPRRMRARLERGDVTIMQATPAKWRLLLEAGWRGGGRPLRMLCGGEALLPALADRLLATGGELWNVYGPTEATVWCALQRIEPGYDRITIGRPITGMQLMVVDEALRPVPPGIDGELVIGGTGLARGYCGRPDLTAERFVEHPGLGRIYRTGDRCRQLSDGRFEWLGRLDHQVKIAGVRVELGEIEARLEAVPGVSQAVVVAHPREGGEASLCAYWVGTAEREALVAAARRFLPAPVVPSAWVRLPRMPLSTNGKVDRKQLPPPAAGAVVDELGKRPGCDAELRIATIFGDVLGLPHVPVDRDFFALGGTSVLATRVALRLRDELGVEVPLRLLFEAPTVEQLAARLGHDLRGDEPIVVTLRRGAGSAPLFCLLGVHLYQDLAHAMRGDRPVIGMHVPLRHEPGGPTPSLASIAARYVALVRRHQPRGPYQLLGLCFGGIVAYEVARQLEAEGERVDTVTIVDAVLPSAVHVDAVGRLRSAVGAVLHEPQELRRRLDRRFERISARAGWPPPAARGLVELAVDGPAVEAEVRRFSEIRTRIGVRLLVVRATGAPGPDWQIIDREQGWGGRARHVRVLDVPADHLGVLREPHVRALARVLDELRD
jgi:amino acid adenylation domain-containing protein